jgi:hypothetical protein
VDLEEIDFEGNRLTTLPDSFVNLTKLTKLYISRNHFATFPPCVRRMPSIMELFVKYVVFCCLLFVLLFCCFVVCCLL